MALLNDEKEYLKVFIKIPGEFRRYTGREVAFLLRMDTPYFKMTIGKYFGKKCGAAINSKKFYTDEEVKELMDIRFGIGVRRWLDERAKQVPGHDTIGNGQP